METDVLQLQFVPSLFHVSPIGSDIATARLPVNWCKHYSPGARPFELRLECLNSDLTSVNITASLNHYVGD